MIKHRQPKRFLKALEDNNILVTVTEVLQIALTNCSHWIKCKQAYQELHETQFQFRYADEVKN